MFIHYNNGQKQHLIEDVIAIEIIDGHRPAVVLSRHGKEIAVLLEDIEGIYDDELRQRTGDER